MDRYCCVDKNQNVEYQNCFCVRGKGLNILNYLNVCARELYKQLSQPLLILESQKFVEMVEIVSSYAGKKANHYIMRLEGSVGRGSTPYINIEDENLSGMPMERASQ